MSDLGGIVVLRAKDHLRHYHSYVVGLPSYIVVVVLSGAFSERGHVVLSIGLCFSLRCYHFGH